MNEVVIKSLKEIVGEKFVITERDKIQDYLVDETVESLKPKPADDVVSVKPANTEEVSKILKFANENKSPIFPRGGGTGLVGGAVPTVNGIVLSLERMNRLEIDKDNLMAVAEAGVTLENSWQKLKMQVCLFHCILETKLLRWVVLWRQMLVELER
jgi:glycolate oxidase